MTKKKAAVAQPLEAGVEQTRVVKAGKAEKKETAPPVSVATQPSPLHRVTVLLSEADRKALLDSKGQATSVTAFGTKSMTDSQKAYRAAYVQRPEVKEKMKAYRAKRAAEKRAAAVKAVVQQAKDDARKRKARKPA
jgi:hypothetical protein